MAKRYAKAISAFCLLTMVLMMATVVVNAVGPPTVNGLFYGDGDQNNYYLLASNPDGRADLYYNLVGTTLYVTTVVSYTVNDNVLGIKGKKGPDAAYLTSAGWNPNSGHTAYQLIESDHISLTLKCGTNSWTWAQDYADDTDNDRSPIETDWFSDYTGDDGAGTPPPGISSASSLVWNLNNAAANPGTAWDVTLGGARGDYTQWKSVDGDGDNDVTDEGYPTYNSTYQWEWPLVYEMSMNVSTCGSYPISITVNSAHNSPPKGESEDVVITETVLVDYGDAPDTYATDKTDGGEGVGASHNIIANGPFLGASVDAEADGQPNVTATGDDVNDGTDDEDGVSRDMTDHWTNGNSVDLTVVVNGCSVTCYLNGWIDWGVDGSFTGDQVFTNETVTNGSYTKSITVPGSGTYTEGADVYARFRLCSASGSPPTGCNSITGEVTSGEVEDYWWEFSPTAVTLTRLEATSAASRLPIGAATAALALLASGVLVGGVVVRRRRR